MRLDPKLARIPEDESGDDSTKPSAAELQSNHPSVARKAPEQEEDYHNEEAADGTSLTKPAAVASSSGLLTDIQDDDASTVWFREEERWELTWPIWHMLSRQERKDISEKHGYKTIGEFEEYMTLQRAVGDSTTVVQEPYDNKLAYAASISSPEQVAVAPGTVSEAEVQDRKPAAVDNDDDSAASDHEELEQDMESEQIAAADKLPTDRLLATGGQILILPDEMLHRVFEWLPVDAYATLAQVSPHWKSFTRTEAVYKRLCERLYLNQSKRRALHVSRFGNSYRTMLEKRPRVRAGGGVYVLKYTKVKKIQRDMWTEIPIGAVLESTYYRYLYFQEDGRVLYALTPSPPHDMFRRFLRICLTPGHEDAAAVWGTYQVSGKHVTVTARQPWQYVKLEMTIETNIQIHGRYGYLSFDKHVTSNCDDFNEWDASTVEFDVPEQPFRFVKERRL